MNNKKLIFKTNKIGFLSGVVLAAALTQWAGNVGAQPVVITVTPPRPPAVIIVPPPVLVAPPVVVEDNYVYYPSYGVYYNSGRHQYAYLNGDAWVMAPTPHGVSVDVLLASPSVKMDFHDSPERHHAEMMKRYPKNWTQHDDHQDRQDHQEHQDSDHQDHQERK
jgi:hypothetical protein